MVQKVFDTFLNDTVERQVNLSSHTRRPIEAALKNRKFDDGLFEEAELEVAVVIFVFLL